MATQFRRGSPEQLPTAGRLDELMANPPKLALANSMTAYRDGSRVRRKVYFGLIGGIGLAVTAGVLYSRHLAFELNNPTARYTVAEGTEDEIRTRRLVWSDGFARLALSRAPPGVNAIVLPDRVIYLAEGVQTAQLKINVVDGKTVQLKVLTGDITVTEVAVTER